MAWGLVFTDSHNSPLGTIHTRALGQKQLWSFPQIHRAHHNNKLYSFRKLVKVLVAVIIVVKKNR
jgi:hypothetical protein